MTAVIEKSLYLPVGRDIVWLYLTDAQKLGDWFHPSDTDMTPGAAYTLTGRESGNRLCWGMVEEARAPEYLRWSFTVGPANGVMSTVEWHLEDASGGTKLRLIHSDLPDHGDGWGLVLSFDKGWHGFLASLRDRMDDEALAQTQPAA